MFTCVVCVMYARACVHSQKNGILVHYKVQLPIEPSVMISLWCLSKNIHLMRMPPFD